MEDDTEAVAVTAEAEKSAEKAAAESTEAKPRRRRRSITQLFSGKKEEDVSFPFPLLIGPLHAKMETAARGESSHPLLVTQYELRFWGQDAMLFAGTSVAFYLSFE